MATDLRPEIARGIKAGMLPSEPAQTVWAGAGTAKMCSVCDGLIKHTDTEVSWS